MLVVTRDIRDLPDMYALGQSGIHIRQSPHARVTTITYCSVVYACAHIVNEYSY